MAKKPTKQVKKIISYSISLEAKQLLEKLAAANDRSASSMLEQLIKSAAKGMKG